jgi:hypothetical protein
MVPIRFEKSLRVPGLHQVFVLAPVRKPDYNVLVVVPFLFLESGHDHLVQVQHEQVIAVRVLTT